MAQIIKTTGEIKYTTPKNGTDFSAEELHEIVGGFFEIFRLSGAPGKILVVDEEGRLKNKPINELASIFYGRVIVGDVLMCDRNEVK